CGNGSHPNVRYLSEIDGSPEPKLIPGGNGGIEDGVPRTTARRGCEAQLIAAELRSQIFKELGLIIPVRLVQLKESKSAEEDVVGTGEALAGQQRGEHAAAGGLS